METILVFILAGAAFLAVIGAGILLLVKAFYRKVEQGQALVVNKITRTDVSFLGGLVIPVIHKAETMDISLKTIEIDRRGKDGLICKDNIRADIKVTFFVRVNKTKEDVVKVASSVGCRRASDQETVEALFVAMFSEALKTVGYNMEFVELYNQRDKFKSEIVRAIGEDLNGYHLQDAAIDYLEQTPIEALDPQNILDANGIRKITQLTVDMHIATNERENHEKQEITRQNVTAQERILDLERQREEAKAIQQREVETIQATAQADIMVKKSAERERAEKARIAQERNVGLEEVESRRSIEVAQKNRERVVLVEQERVLKDRNLEAIDRQRQEDVNTIQKEKQIEGEKKLIADVIRERVAVEKGVAEEEERIKDLRAFAGAERQKKVVIVTAEGQAEEALVKDIKAAEARERAASHLAKERIINAEAELDATDKETRARIRRAEGTQAETAAPGLGEVKVKEADAMAREKLGMADVHVKDANADATEKVGLAEANVLKQKMLAEAKGIEEQGMAKVRVEENEASAIEKKGLAQAMVTEKNGLAEATAVKERLLAEANGLAEKAAAMKALDESGRGHEEFRLELGVKERIQKEALDVNRDIAEAQARLLGEAFKNTKIDIVGGDGEFFQRFVNAVGFGKSIDGFIDKSKSTQTLLKGYLEGGESLPADLKEVLSRPAVSAEDVQRLTVAALLGSLMKRGSAEQQTMLGELLEKAKDLGVDKMTLA